MLNDETVLISIHAEHARKILAGEKRLEFRRVWATRPVTAIVIYVTTPVKKIVAIASVKKLHKGSKTRLWSIAKELGGGLSRQSLYDYMKGKAEGFAVELENVQRFPTYLDPEKYFKNFRAPQSFSYVPQKAVSQLQEELERQRSVTPGYVLFVAGVHGVGKTTLCDNYAKKHHVTHKSSGQLIHEMKLSLATDSGKAVVDIDGNQRLLVEAVSRIRSAGQTLLLDGHFALLDLKNNPKPISTAVFSALGIDGVAVILDDPNSIAARLKNRDGHSIPTKNIASLQKLELVRATQVAEELCIPLIKLKTADDAAFDMEFCALNK